MAKIVRKNDFETNLHMRIAAGYGVIYVPTTEESRVEKIITQIARKRRFHVAAWDHVEGFQPCGQPEEPNHYAKSLFHDLATDRGKAILQPAEALFNVGYVKLAGDTIFVMRDLVEHFQQMPNVRRWIRTYARDSRLMGQEGCRPIVMIGPYMELDQRLKSSVTVVEFELPDETQLMEVAEYVLHCSKKYPNMTAKQKKDLEDSFAVIKDDMVQAALGMTTHEAEQVMSLSIAHCGTFTSDILKIIKDEKASIVKKNDILTYYDEDKITKAEEIGGYEHLKRFVDLRKHAYSREAHSQKIDMPKGIVLLGAPGTGKSVASMAVSRQLGLPLYILDVGAVFGSLVGQSEARMRDAIKQVEAQKGCVLLIDEADKGFGGASTSSGDSGVTRRVFGTLLTWLATKQDKTFVIMTMNRTDGIPPEMLRAGRFDAVFCTELPGPEERREILQIHLEKRGVDMADINPVIVDEVIRKTEHFTGAEIEQVVKDARMLAWGTRKTGVPGSEDFALAVGGVTPVAGIDENKADMASMLAYCKSHGARPVTQAREKKSKDIARHIAVGNNN